MHVTGQKTRSIDKIYDQYRKIFDHDNNHFETWITEYQLERFIQSFGNNIVTAEEKEKLERVRQNRNYQQSIRSFEKYQVVFQEEKELMVDELRNIGVSDLRNVPLKSTDWWTSKIQMINGHIKSKRLEKRNMGLRLKDFLWRNCYEQGAIQFEKSGYDIVLKYDVVWKMMQPESHFPWIRSAICHLKMGDEDETLKNLKMATKKGFSNKDYIEKNFTELSDKKDYQKILEDLVD
jgi:hypothetical protein